MHFLVGTAGYFTGVAACFTGFKAIGEIYGFSGGWTQVLVVLNAVMMVVLGVLSDFLRHFEKTKEVDYLKARKLLFWCYSGMVIAFSVAVIIGIFVKKS